jgi:hypothetical protein
MMDTIISLVAFVAIPWISSIIITALRAAYVRSKAKRLASPPVAVKSPGVIDLGTTPWSGFQVPRR